MEQWLLACAEMDAVAGNGQFASAELGSSISTKELYGAYSDFTRHRGARPEATSSFGKVLTKICGHSKRLPANLNTKRPPGYSIPKAKELSKRVHRHLKIVP